MDDMQQLLMRVLFEVTESRIETRQEFALFRREVDQRFEKLEQRFDQRFERLENEMKEANQRIDRVEASIVRIDATIERMDADIKTMDSTIKTMDAKNNERFIQVHEHIDRVDQARIEGEQRIMHALDLIVDRSGLGQQIVKKPTVVIRG